jgi:hypothetical protein
MFSSFLRNTLVLAFIALLTSCRNRSENELAIYRVLSEGLLKSAATTNSQTLAVLHSLEDKLADPVTSTKARIWSPKAILAHKYGSEMFDYIQNIKTEILKKAGCSGKNDGAFDEGNITIVKQLFKSEAKGEALEEKLEKYKDDLLSIDPLIRNEFSNHIEVIPSTYDSLPVKKGFSTTYFNNIPVTAALAMLSQLQNNVKTCAYTIVNFCNSQCSYDAFVYDFYESLISQSSKILSPGDELEIKAGVGAFISNIKPQVSFNGKKALIGDYGFATYKIRTSGKEGLYIIPVSISYTDQDGIRQTINREVKYRLVKM